MTLLPPHPQQHIRPGTVLLPVLRSKSHLGDGQNACVDGPNTRLVTKEDVQNQSKASKSRAKHGPKKRNPQPPSFLTTLKMGIHI